MKSYIRAAWLGGVAGLRATVAPTALSVAVRAGSVPAPRGPLGKKSVMLFLCACCAAELIVDKLPIAQARTIPPALAARLVSGSLVGAALDVKKAPLGALAGALGAALGTFGGLQARTRLTQATGMPTTIALFEDALALGVAGWAVS